MAAPVDHLDELEEALLRGSVDALEADRHHCDDCGRTPLIGEEMHTYGGRRERVVCTLCSLQRRGLPLASETVGHGERGHAVRIIARAA